ncbi:hypothetical protein L210DRAFT_900466 [Boletus edulis BED1]|uniref:Uncharacterized protein n=1 Tax=Boletus edulis BED1 TaxID=1328754 RepID=A0AAD4G941_BOLED|nr:hypothetical protein L210DRAFT_900466 [Boletus edulis BED1]
MSSFLDFKFVAVALTYALLASAAVPNKRSVQWLQHNGPAAKALNDQYQSLTATTSCSNDGDFACIQNQFATCYEGRYVLSACHSGWSCAALPNEWDEGTTTTCDTNDNISYRFSQAGVSEYKRSFPDAKRSLQWLQQNGPAAKQLNDQYATLTTSSSCNDGDVACVGGQFATCYEGSYQTWSCGDLTCAAIPNEWSQGTTTLCDTSDDIAWRFSQAGVSEN